VAGWSEKTDQHIERDFNFPPGVQGQVVDAVFKGDNPTVEQVARADLLAAKIVNEENSPIRFNLEGRFIEFVNVIEHQV